MKQYVILLCFSLSFFSSRAQQTISGLLNPESAVAYKDGYFVSDIGSKLDAMAKDGDGAISWVRGGRIQSYRYFNDTLHAPKGLEIITGNIYVADIDHLKGYNIISREKIFDLNLEGKVMMLNDITSVNDSLLLVTDCLKGNVLLVNVHSGSWSTLKGDIPVPNGVVYDAKTDQVYICAMGPGLDGTGKLYTKKLGDGNDAFRLLEGTPAGVLDGIVQLDDTHLLISDWITIKEPQRGNLYVYDLAAKSYRTISTGRAPADIALDRRSHTLLIPRTLDNRLEILPLSKLGW